MKSGLLLSALCATAACFSSAAAETTTSPTTKICGAAQVTNYSRARANVVVARMKLNFVQDALALEQENQARLDAAFAQRRQEAQSSDGAGLPPSGIEAFRAQVTKALTPYGKTRDSERKSALSKKESAVKTARQNLTAAERNVRLSNCQLPTQ